MLDERTGGRSSQVPFPLGVVHSLAVAEVGPVRVLSDSGDDRCGRLVHDGSPGLTDQLLSAVPRQTDNGWRLSKGKSKRKIDAAVALVMALDRATATVEEPPHWPIWAFIA